VNKSTEHWTKKILHFIIKREMHWQEQESKNIKNDCELLKVTGI